MKFRYCKIKKSQSLYNNQNGFTLVEMMIAMAITLLVMSGVSEVFTSQQKAFQIQDQVAEMQQNARVALDFMTREIRMAGYIPEDWDGENNTKVPTIDVSDFDAGFARNAGAADIEELGANAITFEADIDGDGQTETVRYARDTTNDTLVREVSTWNGTSAWGASGGQQPLAENITTLTFAYCEDAPCFVGSATETAIASKIRIIQIQLIARTARDDPGFAGGFDIDGDPATGTARTRTLTANVRPRNLGL